MSKWMEDPLCLPEETEQAFKKHEMPILAEAYGCIMGAVGVVTDGALESELGKRWGKRTARKIAKEIEERLIFDIGALIGEAAIRTANAHADGSRARDTVGRVVGAGLEDR